MAELIGFTVVEIGGGRAVGSLQSGPQHANPMGTLHGGVLCDLADAAMGMAFVSTLAPDESFTTISLSIQFFRPVWQVRGWAGGGGGHPGEKRGDGRWVGDCPDGRGDGRTR